MALVISAELMEQIHQHGEQAYPEEGAGLMLGETGEADRRVLRLQTFANAREDSARHNPRAKSWMSKVKEFFGQ